MTRPQRLEIFDFDWTLFRSPCAPAGRSDWWRSLESLNPPNVPTHPSSKWWIDAIRKEAEWSSQDPTSMTVVMTGRRGRFCQRIAELTNRADIFPDFYFCYGGPRSPLDGPDEVIAYKMQAAEGLLQENPSIETLIVYEDLKPQLDAFAELALQYGLRFHPIHVKVRESEGYPWLC